MISYGRQDIRQCDIDAVVETLQSDYLTQGPRVSEFETLMREKVGAAHAVATNSATSALHIACLSLGLGKGDWLWTSPITFVASANCALYCGARVDFVDIDADTGNLSPSALEEKLIIAERNGTLPRVLVAVHLCGQSCDMQRIRTLADRYGVRVIEDASHAVGGRYQGRYIGDCRYSDITIFSFHPVKIITTGEGGMALTNDASLARQMALLRSHGITRDEELMTHDSDGPWYYQQVALGFNYRMTDIQAALGCSQFARLDEYVAERREMAAVYDSALQALPVRCLQQIPEADSAWHLYVIRIPGDAAGDTRREVHKAMLGAGIGVNLHYIPVHTQPFYRNMGFSHGDFPEAERYYAEAMSLPLHPLLADIDIRKVIQRLGEALNDLHQISVSNQRRVA